MTRRSSSNRRRAGESRVSRALRIFARRDPAPAARAASALAALREGGSPASWRASRLTADRYPVEFTCSPDAASIRYTVEVPAASPGARVAESHRRLARLGAPPMPARLQPRIDAILREGPLDFGVWVGGRHDADADRYKLYVEVPRSGSAAADRLVAEYLGDRAPARRHPVRMLGFDLSGGTLEMYFRVEGRWTPDVPLARTPAAPGDPLALLAGYDSPAPTGFSLTLSPGGEVVASSLFAFAAELFGGDADVRRRVLEFGATSGSAWRTYADLTRPLARRRRARDLHGLLAVVATVEARTHLRIGVSPPAAIVSTGRRL